MNQQPHQPGLFIGIDWADQKHDIHVIDRNGKVALEHVGAMDAVELRRAIVKVINGE